MARAISAAGLAAMLFSATAACGGESMGASGECVPTRVTTLRLNEASPDGFSAAEIVTLFGDSLERDLIYQREPQVMTKVSLRLSMVENSKIQFSEFDVRSPYPECITHLAFRGTIQLRTEDGLFDEELKTDVRAYSAKRAYWSAPGVPNDALEGTFSIHEWMDTTPWSQAERDSFEIVFSGFLDGDYAGGTLGGRTFEQTDDAGSWMVFPVAFWGSGPPGSRFPIQENRDP